MHRFTRVRLRQLLFFLALSSLTWAHIASAQGEVDWRGYFPLAVGNVWQYHAKVPHSQFGNVVAIWQIEWRVASDSTVNAEQFYLIEGRCDSVWTHGGLYGQPCDPTRVDSVFVRYDDASANVVRLNPTSDEPCRDFFFGRDFRLDVEAGTVGPSPRACTAEYQYSAPELSAVTVGGEVVEARLKAVTADGAVSMTRRFGHGLGMTYSRTCSDECVERTLTYARVGNEETGDPIAIPRPRLLVESSSPAPFATDVALQNDVSIQFNEPLQWTDPDAAVAFLIAPGSVILEGPALGGTPASIAFDVQHEAGTDYTWVISGARAEGDIELDFPHVLRYSTAGSWGAHSVSGSVFQIALAASEGGRWLDPRRFIVALLNEAPVGETFSNFSAANLAAAARVESDYTYRITRVRPGTYWPVAVLDENGDGQIDRYDLYGAPPGESITVQAGDLGDIDFYVLTGGSADELPAPSLVLFDALYPNPASSHVTLQFRLDAPAVTHIELHNALGQRMGTVLEPSLRAPGDYTVHHDLGTLASGWYFLRVSAGGAVQHRGLVIVQ